MNKGKMVLFSMIAGAALGATASVLTMKAKPKTNLKKTAGNAIKAVGSFVEHMSF